MSNRAEPLEFTLSYTAIINLIEREYESLKKYEATPGASAPAIARRREFLITICDFVEVSRDTAYNQYIKGLDIGRREVERKYNPAPSRYDREAYRAAHNLNVIIENPNLY